MVGLYNAISCERSVYNLGIFDDYHKERRKLVHYAIRIMRFVGHKDCGYHCVDSGHVGFFEACQRSVVYNCVCGKVEKGY